MTGSAAGWTSSVRLRSVRMAAMPALAVFLASLLLGIADVAGKYYLSSALGGFVIYVVLIVVLIVRPNGLFARAR